MSIELVVLLYVVSIALLLAEVFVPGGILGVLGAIGLGTSIYFGFTQHGTLIGLLQIIVAVIVLPIALYLGLKRLALKKELKTEEGFIAEKDELVKLLYQEGITLTRLHPTGIVRIEGRKVDVVTEGGIIERDIKIKVIKVEGNRVVVRAIE